MFVENKYKIKRDPRGVEQESDDKDCHNNRRKASNY